MSGRVRDGASVTAMPAGGGARAHRAVATGASICVEVSFPRRLPGAGYLAAKRVLDVFAAVVSLVVLAIPMAVIALLVRLDSPGPALFRQERLGRAGRPFTIYKYRSMRMDAECDGPQWAERDDERCTRLGRVLRRTRMDELPQLWNILRGDMSFVGPRPERPVFYGKFEEYVHGFRYRLLVTPGLTGLAQVNGGYDLMPEEKIIYDIRYIETCSLMVDLSCVLRTVRLVFTHEGAR